MNRQGRSLKRLAIALSGLLILASSSAPAIAAEATPNTEMALIADLDLDKLAEIRRNGSVRNLRDRRLDLYQVNWTGGKKV